jgi:hypothetical protein
MSYDYDRRVAKKGFDPAQYDLDGLLKGESVTLYHGTTRSFKVFDLNKSRTDLVDRYYGSGVFLTPWKWVAEKYANANRNIGFDPEIIDDLKRANPKAGAFMQKLYDLGDDAWEEFTSEALGVPPEGLWGAVQSLAGGVDPNTIADATRFILGSKLKSSLGDADSLSLFSQSTGLPGHIYDSLDELGIDSSNYRPKVYKVGVKVDKTLVTPSKSLAKSAKSKGYDAVIYHGTDLVGGVPEVAVFNPKNVRVLGVELV